MSTVQDVLDAEREEDETYAILHERLRDAPAMPTPYACPHCSRRYPSRAALDRHIEVNHVLLPSKHVRVKMEAVRTGASCVSAVGTLVVLARVFGVL